MYSTFHICGPIAHRIRVLREGRIGVLIADFGFYCHKKQWFPWTGFLLNESQRVSLSLGTATAQVPAEGISLRGLGGGNRGGGQETREAAVASVVSPHVHARAQVFLVSCTLVAASIASRFVTSNSL